MKDFVFQMTFLLYALITPVMTMKNWELHAQSIEGMILASTLPLN